MSFVWTSPQIDLDTIDLSNLNRQFLFRKEHVKRPKSIVSSAMCYFDCGSLLSQVARETASQFNPEVEINAIHGNIKDAQFSVDYFKSFDLVLNALDNLGALISLVFWTYRSLDLAHRRPPSRQQDVRRRRRPAHRVRHGRLPRSSRAHAQGHHHLLRLHPQGDAQDLSHLHYPKYAEHADPLHRLGKELPLPVRRLTMELDRIR
jgi:hypothetical protein